MLALPADERPHMAGTELHWSESWDFDFASTDGSLGGWARLVLLPNDGVAWYHAFLTGPDRQLVAVIDTEVPLPVSGLEIRTTGLWATHICEIPLDHWTIGLEAFGLGVDDPSELYGRQFGDRVPLGFDLEWEATGLAADGADQTVAYDQGCRVSGEILVGADEIDFDGFGRRSHHWGPRRGWDARWFRVHGRLDDGTDFAASMVDGDLAGARGRVAGTATEVVSVSETVGSDGLPRAARVVFADLEIGADPVAPTPLELVDAEGRVTRAPRSLIRCVAADGRAGVGWAEWNLPRR